MKKVPLILLLLISLISFSQLAPPQAFSYSAVARNGIGNPLVNQSVGIQFSILQGSTTGPIAYQENQFTTTNTFGVFTLMLGTGQIQQGVFNTIAWGHNAYYLKVGLDATGGTNFQTMGITQFLSVPYSMYADSAGNTNHTYQILSISNDTLYLSNGGNVYLGGYRDSLILHNDTLSLSHGNKVVLPGANLVTKINGVPITDPSINHVQIGPTTFLTVTNYRYDLMDESGYLYAPPGDTLELSNYSSISQTVHVANTSGNCTTGPFYLEKAKWYSYGGMPGRIFKFADANSPVYYIPLNAVPVILTTFWYDNGGTCTQSTTPITCYQVFPNDPAVTGYSFSSYLLAVTYTR